MQKVIGYKFPEKPQHLGLKIESILRKRLNKVNSVQGAQLLYQLHQQSCKQWLQKAKSLISALCPRQW